MEYNSFYGGRRGASFIITKSYKSITEMVAAFSQGGAYKVVDYDDYVLIDTENKNDPDNGKLYRRGYDYNNDMGGAVYEGQIVGPAGLAPHTEIDTVNNVEQKATQEGYEYRRGTGEYKLDDNSLVPGKYVESGSGVIRYNDKITWAYCSVRDLNSYESTAYIGFTFPYTVIDFTATSESAYLNPSVKRVDDGTHPFYEEWSIKIPKGIKGDDLKNFRVMVADNTIQSYDGQADDITNHREVLVYDLYSYENSEEGEHLTYYVGDYNKINNINVSSNGLVTIEYSHDDADNFQMKIPTSVTINTGTTEGTGTQKVIIYYSDGTSQEIGNPLNYIMETALDENYHLLTYYSSPEKRAEIVIEGKNASYDGKNDWHDLGYIGNGIILNPIEQDIQDLKNNIEANLTLGHKTIIKGDSVTNSLYWNVKRVNYFGAMDITQDTSKEIYKCAGNESGNYYFVYDGTNYQFTMPTIEAGSILVFDTTTLKLYLGETEITTTTSDTGTLITLVDTPNPDYEQSIKILNGEITISNYKGYQLFRFPYIYTPSSNINARLSAGIYTLATEDSNVFGSNLYIKLYKNNSIVQENGHLTSARINSFSSSSHAYYGAAGYSSATFTIDDDYDLNIGLLNSLGTRRVILVKGSEPNRNYQEYEGQDFLLTLPEGMYLGKMPNTIYKNIIIRKDDGKFYWHKELQEVILTGNETFNKASNARSAFNLSVTNYANKIVGQALVLCNKFKYKGNAQNEDLGYAISFNSSSQYKNICYFQVPSEVVGIGDTTAFKAWVKAQYDNEEPIIFIYPRENSTDIEITDITLLPQLQALWDNLKTYKNITNFEIVGGDIDGELDINYYIDDRVEQNNRLNLLEEEIAALGGVSI